MENFKVPNWGQNALAVAAGLKMTAPAVVVDNDHLICFMDLTTRIEYTVNKKTGEVRAY